MKLFQVAPLLLLCLVLADPTVGSDTATPEPQTLGRYNVTIEQLHDADRGCRLESVYPSPDRRRVAAVLVDNNAQGCVWVEGQGQSPPWDYVIDVEWSPDSRRLAYLATRDGKVHVVVDGVDAGKYDDVPGHTVPFSSDGSRYGFLAAEFKKDRLKSVRAVIDGTAGESFDNVTGPEKEPLLRFSPGGAHWLMFAKRGDQYFSVVDGRIGPSSTARRANRPGRPTASTWPTSGSAGRTGTWPMTTLCTAPSAGSATRPSRPSRTTWPTA